MYRKPTATGVYLNWTSLTARKYKIGLIRTLLDRIWRICSRIEDREEEITRLREVLSKNEYPALVVNNEINKFRHRKQQQVVSTKPPKTYECKRFIVLPFVQRKAETFAEKLKKLVETNYPQVDFNIAFTAPRTIGDLFPYKDNIKNVEDKSMVVYRIKCKQCEADYIGKTERILYWRIQEHRKQKSSACHEHHLSTGHEMDYENIEVIDQASSDFKIRVKELLHILKRQLTLNKQLNSQSNFDIKTLIIKAYPQHRKADVSGVTRT